MRDAFAKANIYPHISPGEVWKAKDSAIWLVGSLTRHFHEERYCVILSNQEMCSDANWPIVLIAPFSHKTQIVARPDIIVDATMKNGLPLRSRIILSQIQPLDKAMLQERIGEISLSKWEQIVRQVFWHIKRP